MSLGDAPGGLSAQFGHMHVLLTRVGDELPVLIMSCKAGCDWGCWFESQRGISIQSVPYTVIRGERRKRAQFRWRKSCHM